MEIMGIRIGVVEKRPKLEINCSMIIKLLIGSIIIKILLLKEEHHV